MKLLITSLILVMLQVTMCGVGVINLVVCIHITKARKRKEGLSILLIFRKCKNSETNAFFVIRHASDLDHGFDLSISIFIGQFISSHTYLLFSRIQKCYQSVMKYSDWGGENSSLVLSLKNCKTKQSLNM